MTLIGCKRSLLALVVLASALLAGQANGAAMTAPDDAPTSPVAWSSETWGELGIGHLQAAPYPDDTRTTGYQTATETFPLEGHYDDNSVAFVIPRGFRPSSRPDFVVIFHGHRNQCRRFVVENKIGEILASSGRNAILIVPQGPKDAPDSGGGKMEKPGGFAALMEEAVGVLRAEKRLPSDARIGNVVVSGLSGGYRPVATVLDRGGLDDQISEVWLVDAAYSFQAELAKPFASPNSGKTLRSIFTNHLAPENVRIMALIGKSGTRVAVTDDDILTTAPVGTDELRPLLRRERILFIHTNLPHDAFKLSERFLGAFLAESPALKPTETDR